eukprot:TRINITY_DN3800_c0_g1_i2.p1 TRINITY_DN3800_c0_g1~~TRINITY_DN3800_c0_g1_i2.p1  ORF type:complete len:202 (-),score=14.22 TRINITY_DN3800_c0_g1_i2:393-998(-)
MCIRDSNWVHLASKINMNMKFNENTRLLTGLDLYKKYLEITGQNKEKKKWSKEEDEMLLNIVQVYGTNNWKQISNHIEGRDTYQCFQRWFKFVNPKISRGNWKLQEDIKLALAVECYEEGKWILVASHFETRTDVQCRERWCNILDPKLNCGDWTHAEDQELMRLYHLNGPKWSRIAKDVSEKLQQDQNQSSTVVVVEQQD